MKTKTFAIHSIFLKLLVTPLLLVWLTASSLAQPIDASAKVGELEAVGRAIDFLDRVIASADTDTGLIGAREKLVDLEIRIEEIIKPIDNRLNVLSAKLESLGPEPTDGGVEKIEVKEDREAIAAERQDLKALQTQTDAIKKRIGDGFSKIAALRQQLFTNRLSHRSPITIELLGNVWGDSLTAIDRLQTKLRQWWVIKIAPDSRPVFAVLFIFLLALIAAAYIGRRILSILSVKVTRLNALLRPFVKTIVPAGLIALALAIGFWALDFAGLLNVDMRKFVRTIFVLIFGLTFVLRLSSAIFSPKTAELRIVPISEFAASRIHFLVSSLAIVHALDYLARELGDLVSAPLAFSIGNSFIASVLIALLLLALARVTDDKQDKQSRSLPAWVRVPLLIISIAVIVSAVAGYIGLARFMAQQIVVTGTILATTFLGYLLSQELGTPGVIGTTNFGRWAQEKYKLEEKDVDQYALFASIGFFLIVVLAAIPAILLQWGSRVEDLIAWFRQAIVGFEVGNFQFSLASIFYGILIFVIGVILTRIFQSWLANTVLERTRADNGVKDSIRTGVGYIGIALSIFLGITGAGVDLGNLAIVAGALSLGIGFGLQNIVSNFVSGLILLVERPIKIGDFVEAGGHIGTVSKISVRATEIHTIHNQTIIIPNSDFINSAVGNWTHKIKSGRVDIPIGVAYGSDLEKVQKILLEIANDHQNVLMRPEPFVFFKGFGDSSIDFQLRIHVIDYTGYPRVQTDILFAIDKAFRENDIEIPFPQRDLNIRTADPAILDRLTDAKKAK